MIDDPISQQRLALLHPSIQEKVNAAADDYAKTGNYFRVGTGLRTYAEEDALWQKGRDAHGNVIPVGQPGHGTVTNAHGGYSNHNFGMAVDCYPFLAGPTGPLNWDANSAQFKAMVAILKAQGLAWGGDWKSIHDAPHFQLANVPATPDDLDRANFAKGGLKLVWARYPQAS